MHLLLPLRCQDLEFPLSGPKPEALPEDIRQAGSRTTAVAEREIPFPRNLKALSKVPGSP